MSRRVASYAEWRDLRFFPGLQGVRALAALLVVFHHGRGHWLWNPLGGWNGVTIFFVLSGFLITTLGLREEERLGALRWGAFFIRRAFRILPLYLVCLALYAALVLVVGLGAGNRGGFVDMLPWYLSPFPEHGFYAGTHAAFGLAWTLGIEEKFYVVWPLVAFVVLRRRFRARLGLAMAAAVAFQVPVALAGGGRVVAAYTPILVGCALALLMHRAPSFARVAALGSTPGICLSLTALVGAQAATVVFMPAAGFGPVETPFYYLPYSIAAAAFVASVSLRARGAGVLESSPMQLLGAVSYGLYLLNPLGLAAVETVVPRHGVATEVVALAGGAALSVAAAYALHRLVERPLIAVGRRLAARPFGVRTPRALPSPTAV
jgi:peptidoglycan/LPS O-acetylase OafA/YrhL